MSTRRMNLAYNRRGAVLVFVGLSLLVLAALTALAIDIGFRMIVHTEMQSVADSAALAAAGALATEDGNAYKQRGIDAARLYTQYHTSAAMNNAPLNLPVGDVVYGDAVYNAQTRRWGFSTPSNANRPFGIRVTLRRDNIVNPRVPWFFSSQANTNLVVSSTAMVAPRDIVLVLDLSRSMSDDSVLNRRANAQVNLRDIWVTLESTLGSPSTRNIAGTGVFPTNYVLRSEAASAYSGQVGRTLGSMKDWGTPIGQTTYNTTAQVQNDPGMYYLPSGQTWTGTGGTLGTTRYNWLVNDAANPNNLTLRGHSPAEITTLMGTGGGETTAQHRNRVKVVLGFANWHDTVTVNSRVDDTEITDVVDEPYNLGAGWNEWIDYVRNGYGGNTVFTNRYGLKSYVNWLVDSCYGKTPGIPGSTGYTPNLQFTVISQLQACKDAILGLANALKNVSNDPESSDRIGMVYFGTTAADDPYNVAFGLTSDFDRVADMPYPHQPGEIGGSTNTSQALMRAFMMVQGPNSRPFAHKMIVLLTDGLPTVSNGYATVNPNNAGLLNAITTVPQFEAMWGSGGSQSASTEAENVVQVITSGRLGLGGAEVVTVGVGTGASVSYLTTLANYSGGTPYMAVPNPNDPTVLANVLQQIFQKIASRRPVALID